VGGWESRYPKLVGSGFREVWERSLRYPAGDPRFFVRFSSWTSAPILERLQPMLDRVWARTMSVTELAASLPEINRSVRTDLDRLIKRGDLRPAFTKAIDQQLQQASREPQR
jgi:hypothetical protein